MNFDRSKTSNPLSRKRSTIILVIGGYFNTGIQIVQTLLLVPLYIHYIGLHLYGLWLASGGILAMLGVVNFGVGSLLTQRVAQAYGQHDLHKAGSDFINGLAVYLILVAIFVGVGMLFSFNLSHLLIEAGPNEKLLRECFQIALLATALGFVNECLRSFANALLRPLYIVLAVAGARVSGLVITVSLLYNQAGLWAIPVGLLCSEGIALLFGSIQSLALCRTLGSNFRLNRELIKEYFSVGGLLFFARLGNALSRDTDPLLISLFFRPEITAAYMVTRRAADVVFQLISVINSSMFGSFAHLAGSGDTIKTGRVTAKLFGLVFYSSLVGYVAYVALDSSFVKLWVGEIFALDQRVILLIGVAYLLNNLRNMVLHLLNGLGEFRLTAHVAILEGVARIVLVVLLLNWLGVPGVPLSLAVVSFTTLFATGIALYNRISIPISLRMYAKGIILYVVLYGLAVELQNQMVAHSWGQFVMLGVAYVAAIVALLFALNSKIVKMLLHA